MDDITSKLSEFLNNPESLNKIKGLAGLLGQDSDNNSPTQENKPERQNESPEIPIDTMKTVMKFMPIISSINKEDENTKFLQALKPLLGDERKKKIDESIRMIQMMRVIPLLKNQEILSL